MNIFKLLGFRKMLFCLLKACLMIAFNMFFLLILIDEFISLSVLANITWFRLIYFSLFYNILFYLFCFYLRKDLDNLEDLPKLKSFKKKFLERFKKVEKPIEEKEIITKKVIVSQKKKKKLSKKEITLKIFWFLFYTITILIVILFNPWTYLLFIFLFVLWNAGGLFEKLLTIFLLLTIFGTIGIMFFETDEKRKDFFNSRL